MKFPRIRTTDHACTCGSAHAAPARGRTRDGVTASGMFTTEQIGERQSMTPEGFLLCEAVPIARIGSQDYVYSELPDLEAKDGIIVAERGADVLFSPETLASFEGKPVTIDHPPDFVTPANYMSVARGTVRNVRRGEGAQSDLMLADLLITDAEAIRRVQSDGFDKLDQVSNGYDADYEQIAPGRARQARIVGNHVALVKNARCGPVCSIGDSSPNPRQTGEPDMAKKKSSNFVDALRKAFMTRDADAFEKAATEMTGDEGDEPDNNQPGIHIHLPGTGESKPAAGATGDEGGATAGAAGGNAEVLAAINGVAESVKALGERVTKLESGGTATGDDDGEDDDDDDDGMGTGDDDGGAGDDSGGKAAKTGDSKALANDFREALSLAEILAPGVRLPTFDAKAVRKKTTDSLCVLRRRALRAALDNENAESVKSVLGGADVAGMPCALVTGYFNAAAALVKGKNATAITRKTGDRAGADGGAEKKDINQVHADFWASRK